MSANFFLFTNKPLVYTNSEKKCYEIFVLLFTKSKLSFAVKQSTEMEMERIFPGIYLTLCEDKWTTDKLRAHGFTHIIRIDKHIKTDHTSISNDRNTSNDNKTTTPEPINPNSLDRDHLTPHLDGFETLDLNFGETSYLTTVLPNCYKGVRFIDNALRHGGRVLIVDRITNEKCITVVVGFLMYKDNLKFR